MAPPLMHVRGLSLRFGSKVLFDGAELAVSRGDRICLVGRNGTGRSTLLKVAAGLISADSGERFVQPGVRLAYLPQDPVLSGHATVGEAVAEGLVDASETYRVEALLGELGVSPEAAPGALSGGESRRAALARALVGDPDILLLDEPTNHLDLPTIEWLEDRLSSFTGGVVAISHDRAFLSRLTRQTVWLDRGVARRLDKGFADFEAWADGVLEQEAAERSRLDKKIAEETLWSRQGISARRKRNQGRLRALADLRQDRAEQRERLGGVKLTAESGSISGKLVLEAEGIAYAWQGVPVLLPTSLKVLRGDRVGVVGANGAGKSTLLKILMGKLEPDTGSVRIGTNLTTVYLDQGRETLNDTATVWDTLCPEGGDQVMVRGRPRHVVSYMRDFLFDDAQARSPVGSLSGGERNRLLLAIALAKPSNLLVLDEPTNDLDMETLDLLQETLGDYDGTVLVVSHDRDFLDRVATSIWALEGDGLVGEYVGGYRDYRRQRTAVTSVVSAKPVKGKAGRGEPSRKAGKLSYKDQREWEGLPARLAALDAEQEALEERMSDAGFFGRDPQAFQAATARLGAIAAERAEAEDRWLELELLRDELAKS
ncbi:MAG: ATP-binding cassette domain-containing protein [Rhodospirillaceae bacterium]|nr:ATP-binding cassette domain-containing protein [Rhodospirillaceae bacterium]